MSYVDLHSHSTASDGTLPPAEVVRLAKEAGLSGLALTDHDTVGGIEEAAAEAERIGIDFLPGIEISAEFPQPGTMHILGYGIDPHSEVLRGITGTLLAGRDSRNPKIIARLRELDVAISMEELEAEARRGDPALANKPIGRPHIAAILRRKGYVSSINQAFEKYLAPGGLAYFDKERLSPAQALAAIRDSGGLPVLAHPSQLRTTNDEQLRTIVKDLLDLGLAGIEVIHSDHDARQIELFGRIADQYGLLKTGGSDFHGSNKTEIRIGWAGKSRIPRAMFDELRDACRRVRCANRNIRGSHSEPYELTTDH